MTIHQTETNSDKYSLGIKSIGLREQSVFCFTTDIEWSPEWAIEEVVRFFDDNGIPLTPFITHESPVVNEYFGKADMRHAVGLHPNFFANSSHGRTMDDVIESVCRLWPEAVSFRAHCFYDNTLMTNIFARKGFLFDSNLCLFLQPHSVPLLHASGMLRFPVYWEDDIHYQKKLPFSLSALKSHLDIPGLKVVNIHPLNFALNIADVEYYNSHKYLYDHRELSFAWKQFVFEGRGTRSLIEEMIEHIRRKGCALMFMSDIYKHVAGIL